MILVTRPAELRVTLNHVPVERVRGELVVESVRIDEVRYRFRPMSRRLRRRGLHLFIREPGRLDVIVWAGGEPVCRVNGVDDWWVGGSCSFDLSF